MSYLKKTIVTSNKIFTFTKEKKVECNRNFPDGSQFIFGN